MKAYVRAVVSPLVEHPDRIRISEISGIGTSIVELVCDPSDRERLIGRNSQTLGAIQALVNTVAARRKRRVVLEIIG